MTTSDKLQYSLYLLFLLFVSATTFSIALSQVTLGMAIILFLIVSILEHRSPFVHSLRWFYFAVTLYLSMMFISAMLGGRPLESLSLGREEWLFLAIPVTILLGRKERWLDYMVVVLAAGITIVAVLTAYRYFFMIKDTRITGFFPHPLTFGNYVATAALFVLGYVLIDRGWMARWKRWVLLIGGGAAVATTVASNSRGPIISMIIGLVLLLFFLRGKWRWLGVVTILAAITGVASSERIRSRFIPTEDRSGIERNFGTYWQGSRRFVWENTLEMIRRHPVHGVGVGNFAGHYKEIVGPEMHPLHWYGHAHDDLLNVTAQAGIPGGLSFAILWLTVLIYFWIGYRRAGPKTVERRASVAALLGSIVFFCTSLTESTFVDEEVRTLLMFVWGVGLSCWYRQQVPGPFDGTETEP